MIKLNGYNEVSAGSVSLPADGYIARIVNARIGVFQDGTDALLAAVDIVEGDFAGFFKSDFERLKKFAPNALWSDAGTIKIPLFEDGKIHWRLKKFLEIIKHDNPDLTVIPDDDFDERSLIGKSCGIIVALKEGKKTKSDGSHWTNPYIAYPVTSNIIRSRSFSIPPIRKYQQNSPANTPNNNDDWGGTPLAPDDTPF